MSRTTNDTPRLSRRDCSSSPPPHGRLLRCPAGSRRWPPARPPTRRASVRASSCGWRRPLADGHVRPEARHANGGPFKEIATRPRARDHEHPRIARFGDRCWPSSARCAPRRPTTAAPPYLMRTGYAPTGPIQYPPSGRSWPRSWAPPTPAAQLRQHRPGPLSTRPPTAPLLGHSTAAAGSFVVRRPGFFGAPGSSKAPRCRTSSIRTNPFSLAHIEPQYHLNVLPLFPASSI